MPQESREATKQVWVIIARGFHPFPSRTRQLSPSAPMVLHARVCGRVGRRPINLQPLNKAIKKPANHGGLFALCRAWLLALSREAQLSRPPWRAFCVGWSLAARALVRNSTFPPTLAGFLRRVVPGLSRSRDKLNSPSVDGAPFAFGDAISIRPAVTYFRYPINVPARR